MNIEYEQMPISMCEQVLFIHDYDDTFDHIFRMAFSRD